MQRGRCTGARCPRSASIVGTPARRQFTAWLAEQRLSLAFTTYQSGKLFLLGVQPDGRLAVFERTFNRAMGLAAHGSHKDGQAVQAFAVWLVGGVALALLLQSARRRGLLLQRGG